MVVMTKKAPKSSDNEENKQFLLQMQSPKRSGKVRQGIMA